MIIQKGDQDKRGFSYTTKDFLPLDKQVSCYLIHTTLNTKDIVMKNLDEAAALNGEIVGIGPRYCPSIESKYVRFSTKDTHQIFVEPVSLHSNKMYLQGFSTSMPKDIQEKMVKSLPGFENAEIIEYAYAIEYDAINPLQMKRSLESKIIENLFTAGQINGTSGYEEAAAQGLMAGINASRKLDNKEPFILRRDEAYIGVLIDDLVTKGTEEPYRMLTSRAEYRLLLRDDNAEDRLMHYGHDLGLISDELYKEFTQSTERINTEIERLKTTYITGNQVEKAKMDELGLSNVYSKESLFNLIKRPDYDYKKVMYVKGEEISLTDKEIASLNTTIKYEGYIKKSLKQAEELKKMESTIIPKDINYDDIHNIASEAKEKLKTVNPETLGQASRISGVNPSDIMILSIYLKQLRRHV